MYIFTKIEFISLKTSLVASFENFGDNCIVCDDLPPETSINELRTYLSKFGPIQFVIIFYYQIINIFLFKSEIYGLRSKLVNNHFKL